MLGRVVRWPAMLAAVGVVLFVSCGLVAAGSGDDGVRAPERWRLGPLLGGGGHGWVVLAEERSGRPTQYRLMHLEPRVSGSGGGGGGEGSDGASREDALGTIRLARVFSERPEEVVWDGDRVYVVFPPVRQNAGLKKSGGVVDAAGDGSDAGGVEIVERGSAVDVGLWGGRRVLSARAFQAPIGGRWETYPRGRMEPKATLPGDGAIAGLAGTGRGPAALMRVSRGVIGSAGDGGKGWLLLVLGRGGWAPVVLPWEEIGGGSADGDAEGDDGAGAAATEPTSSAVLSLISMPDGIGLLVRESGAATLWVGNWGAETTDETDGRLRVTWSARGLDLGVPGGLGSGAGSGLDGVGGVEGQVVGWRWVLESDGVGVVGEGGGGALEIYMARRVEGEDGGVGGHGVGVRGRGASLLAKLEGVPATFWVVGMGDVEDATGGSVGGAGARLAVLWHSGGGRDGDDDAGRGEGGVDGGGVRGRAAAGLEIREVSLSTGRLLYSGGARVGGPVSGEEIRLLMAVMIGVTVVVLLFVLRPERRRSRRAGDGVGLPGVVLVPAEIGVLPDDVRLAGAGARLLGAVIDFGIAVGLSMAVHRVGFGEVLGPVWPAGGAGGGGSGGSVAPLLTAMGFAAVISAACEGLTGRSPGKWLTGCRVVSCWVRVEDDEKKKGKGDGAYADDGDGFDDGGRGEAGGSGVVVFGPTWSQAVLRNVVKWGAPPLAVGVLLDPWRRHFGDLLGQTYVVESSPSGSEGEGVPASPTPGSGGDS